MGSVYPPPSASGRLSLPTSSPCVSVVMASSRVGSMVSVLPIAVCRSSSGCVGYHSIHPLGVVSQSAPGLCTSLRSWAQLLAWGDSYRCPRIQYWTYHANMARAHSNESAISSSVMPHSARCLAMSSLDVPPYTAHWYGCMFRVDAT